ncbi:trypco2 family protein [Streptomyces sp. GESEQ-35]|uniref:trypco2 family protein n=1 Tax=Streptomyces sp. GESEQ-35 TaxID=2812657 RepID=UPI001B31C30B|nr:trypco2 family protein [Streptomyces sp. GESEQ-35]
MEIGIREAIEAAQAEIRQALRTLPMQDGVNFHYNSVELELTLEACSSSEKQGGVKFWVVEGSGKRGVEDRLTHTVRISMVPTGSHYQWTSDTTLAPLACHAEGPVTAPDSRGYLWRRLAGPSTSNEPQSDQD